MVGVGGNEEKLRGSLIGGKLRFGVRFELSRRSLGVSDRIPYYVDASPSRVSCLHLVRLCEILPSLQETMGVSYVVFAFNII